LPSGIHPGKAPLFSAEERLEMLQEVFGPVAAKAGCAFEAITYDDSSSPPRSGPALRS